MPVRSLGRKHLSTGVARRIVLIKKCDRPAQADGKPQEVELEKEQPLLEVTGDASQERRS
jgi:hypothetical protein